MAEIAVENVRDAGVVGAGGAGFPTFIKLSAKADTVIINAAECEPLLHKDKEVLRRYADGVLAGLAAGMRLVGAAKGCIGIKDKYKDVIDVLRPKLSRGMEIAALQDAYPAGDEFILTYDVTGRAIPPGGIPLNVGVVTMNVETAINVAASAQTPVVVKYISVAGAVARPVTLRVPVGVTLRQCVEAAGGATVGDARYIVGGVMMGRLETNPDALVTKTTGAVIILPGDHSLVQRYARSPESVRRIARSACDQCCFCTQLCPRYLLGHPVEPHRAMRSMMFNLVGETDFRGTVFCSECNLCSMWACPENLDPKGISAIQKKRQLGEGKKWPNPPFNPSRAEIHMRNRKAPTRLLLAKLGLTGFQNVGPLVENLLATNKVGIALKQHVGAPCEPAVKPGQKVRVGEVVGRPGVQNGKPALGAPVHASIAGTVTAVADGVVWIQK